MANENLRYWEKYCNPPGKVLKTIKAGRLKGMSDINPQWRLLVLTELFGPVGIGWYTEIIDQSVYPADDGTIVASVTVNLYYKMDGDKYASVWSKPVVGMGGSMLVAKESAGLRTEDEAFKKAETDAISVCCKKLGIAADVYLGQMETKYLVQPPEKVQTSGRKASVDQVAIINALVPLIDIASSVANVEKLYKDNKEDIDSLDDGAKADLLALFGDRKKEHGGAK